MPSFSAFLTRAMFAFHACTLVLSCILAYCQLHSTFYVCIPRKYVARSTLSDLINQLMALTKHLQCPDITLGIDEKKNNAYKMVNLNFLAKNTDEYLQTIQNHD